MEPLYTVEEVAEKLKIAPFSVRELLRKRKLNGFKIGKEWRVEESQLEAFIYDLTRHYREK